MTDPDRYRLHQSLGYQLSLAARLQERRLDDWLKPLGMTRTSWCVLLAVGNEGLIHPSAIAKFVGIDRTATSRALRQMEAAGMIARRAGKDDRRMTAVHLTPYGETLLQQGTPLAKHNNAIMEERLGEHENALLRKLLLKIREGEGMALPRL